MRYPLTKQEKKEELTLLGIVIGLIALLGFAAIGMMYVGGMI